MISNLKMGENSLILSIYSIKVKIESSYPIVFVSELNLILTYNNQLIGIMNFMWDYENSWK